VSWVRVDAEEGAETGAARREGVIKVTTQAAQEATADRAIMLSPRRFRQKLAAVRRWRLLANPAPKAAALERWARWRSDAELNVAAVLPDHSPTGRLAAAKALAARGGAVTGLTLAAPSFLAGEQRLSLATFFGWSCGLRRASRLLVIAAASLVLGAILALLGPATIASTAAQAQGLLPALQSAERHDPAGVLTRNAHSFLQDLAAAPSAQAAAQARMALGAGTLSLFASVLIWALCVQARRRPARILVLRPADRAGGKDLQRLVERELRPFGHVVALSEHPVKRTRLSWTAAGLAEVGGPWRAALIVLTTPFRVFTRVLDKARLVDALVASAQDYRSLARRLMDKTGQNFAAEMTTRETIMAKPTDIWREETARLLLRSCDVVVADASRLDPSDSQTLKAWLSPEARGRVVFVSPADRAANAESRLKEAGLSLSHPLVLFQPRRGLADRRGFRETLLAAMRSCGGCS